MNPFLHVTWSALVCYGLILVLLINWVRRGLPRAGEG